MAAPTPEYSAKLEQTQYRNWNVYKLSNGLVSLYIAPEIGGRAIQLQLGDHEFFFVNKALEGKVLPESENNLKAGWANYGGDKAWPGPEGWMNDGEWASIPYYILDGARYTSGSRHQHACRSRRPGDQPGRSPHRRAIHSNLPCLRGHHSDQGGSGDAKHQPAGDSLGHLAPDSE